jgi:hypothetical protein
VRNLIKQIIQEEFSKPIASKKFVLVNKTDFFNRYEEQPGYSKTKSRLLSDLKKEVIKNGVQPKVLVDYTLHNGGMYAIFEHIPSDDDSIKYQYDGTVG